MRIIPLFDRVLLKPVKFSNKTAAGLLLSVNQTENTLTAEVVEISENLANSENNLNYLLNRKILYNKFAGFEFVFDEEKYILLKKNDILAILN